MLIAILKALASLAFITGCIGLLVMFSVEPLRFALEIYNNEPLTFRSIFRGLLLTLMYFAFAGIAIKQTYNMVRDTW